MNGSWTVIKTLRKDVTTFLFKFGNASLEYHVDKRLNPTKEYIDRIFNNWKKSLYK